VLRSECLAYFLRSRHASESLCLSHRLRAFVLEADVVVFGGRTGLMAESYVNNLSGSIITGH